MKWHRIRALIKRHLYLYQRSLPRLMDLFYWPIMELLLWGFISVFIDKLHIQGFNAITVLLGAIIFWDLLTQSQRAVSIAFLEDVWERNFLNIFVTPLKVIEFLSSSVILAFVRICIVTVVMAGLAFLFYRFNFLTFGIYIVPFLANLLLFGATLGFFTTAVILRYGSSAQILAWGFISLLQPFTAVFYPVSVLPGALQYVAYAIPSTYIFEGMRSVIATGSLPLGYLAAAVATNLIYLGLVLWYFYRMFAIVKEKGRLMKLD